MTTFSDALTILVVSDFHACRRPARANKNDPTHFILSKPEGRPDVAAGFLEHLAKEKIKADVVICCGDLIDKTDIDALGHAWDFANDIKSRVQANDLLVCTGNHDIDWKGKTDSYTPFEKLKLLQNPPYPSPYEPEWQSYWSRNYFIRDIGDARFVVFNSCAAMGHRKFDQGVFSPETEQLVSDLRRMQRKTINICVCHHNPHRHGDHGLGESDDMSRGQFLTDALSDHDLGHWLIIHGHKHHAKLSYAQGNSFSPIVFSAGSLSARIWDKIQNYARNQFHLIRFSRDEITSQKRLVGEYKSWSWFPTTGWREAADAEGLPAEGGFGYRDVNTLADMVYGGLVPGTRTQWSQIVNTFKPIKFLIPSDLKYLLDALRTGGVSVDEEKVLGKTTIKNLIR